MMPGRSGTTLPLPPSDGGLAVPVLPRRVPYRTRGVSAVILAKAGV